MKRKIYLVSIISCIVIAISTISLGFSVNMELDKTENLKVNDEVILTLNLSEEIVGATFKINYDSTNLKLVDSQTTNLSVSENDGKIACAYVDMAKTGTNNLKIKFKIVNSTNTTMSFDIEDAKFVSKENEKSYSQSEITSKDVTIKLDNEDSKNDNNTTNNETTSNSNTTNTNNSVTNEASNTVANNIETNAVSNNTTNNNTTNNTSNETNTVKKDNTISTITMPYTGNHIIYILLLVSLITLGITIIRVKTHKFEDKYDK